MKKITSITAISILTLQAALSQAAVSPEEAKQLGAELTRFGAVQAGNADGTIPAYAGGLSSPPADFDPKSGYWPTPFPDDKPLFRITAANMDEHADLLSDGVKAMLKRYGSYSMNVYETRRSVHYPDWVLENTANNAVTARLVGAVAGDAVEGAFGGIPFPIPQSGYEVMWNNYLSFQRTRSEVLNIGQYLVDSSGRRTALPVLNQNQYAPYYDQSLAGTDVKLYNQSSAEVLAPPTMAGTAFLINYPMDYDKADQQTWLYSPGQRRVRQSPDYKYDTPNGQNGGVLFWDELQLFRGRMDRFNFNLVGKQEMYIPYNNYSRSSWPVDELYGRDHLNPEAIRWERHRVWVVDANLKEGARHAYSKRRFYFDEDTWSLVSVDAFDQEGKIWRVGLSYQFNLYDGGGGFFGSGLNYQDLQKGNYFAYLARTANGSMPKIFVYDQQVNPSIFTTSGLAGRGVR